MWCSVVAILCVVMYLMVCLFVLNRAGTTTVHVRLETSSVLPVDQHIWGVVFPEVVVMLMGKKCCSTDVLNRFTINFFILFRVLSLKS